MKMKKLLLFLLSLILLFICVYSQRRPPPRPPVRPPPLRPPPPRPPVRPPPPRPPPPRPPVRPPPPRPPPPRPPVRPPPPRPPPPRPSPPPPPRPSPPPPRPSPPPPPRPSPPPPRPSPPPPPPQPSPPLPPLPHIEQVQFIFRWPATYCLFGCGRFPPNKFTVGGFWGTDFFGTPQIYCPDSAEPGWPDSVFTEETVTELEEFWPALFEHEQPKELWENAWYAYGTCTAGIMYGPEGYFGNAIRLYHEMGDLLVDNLEEIDGIIPSETVSYPNHQVLNAFTRVAHGNQVSFSCVFLNATHAYLFDVTFCYANDVHHFTNCPSSYIFATRCTAPNIIIPLPASPRLLNGQTEEYLRTE